MSRPARIFWALLLLAAGNRAAADPPAGILQVEIRLPAGATGEVRVALCSSLNQFLDRQTPARRIARQAAGTSVTLPFTNLPPGRYALKAYLDRNGNQELDLDWLGLPQEPWAISNDIRAEPSPRSWESAAFPFDPAANPAPPLQILDLK